MVITQKEYNEVRAKNLDQLMTMNVESLSITVEQPLKLHLKEEHQNYDWSLLLQPGKY